VRALDAGYDKSPLKRASKSGGWPMDVFTGGESKPQGRFPAASSDT